MSLDFDNNNLNNEIVKKLEVMIKELKEINKHLKRIDYDIYKIKTKGEKKL